MKKLAAVFLAVSLIIAVGAAIVSFAPASVKDMVSERFEFDLGMFEKSSAPKATDKSKTDEIYKERLEQLSEQEKSADLEVDKLLNDYILNENDKEYIKSKIRSDHGEFRDIKNLNVTVKAYVLKLIGPKAIK